MLPADHPTTPPSATAGAALADPPARTTVPVTVVMPAYGHADYIVASLESVLAGAAPPREVIVVDDGSPDDTAARVAPLARAGRVRYVRQPNAGMAAARNAGARLATSEYLYFLDDDDLAYPGALAWLTNELDRHPEAGMAFGELVTFTDAPPPPPDYWSEPWDVDRVPFMLFNQLGCPGQVLVRRSAFEAVGGFDASIWGTDDWDLWLRLLARFPARAARRPVLAYRLHANNASRDVARMYRSSLAVARRGLRGFAPHERTLLRRYSALRLREYHAPRLVQMARAAVGQGDWRRAGRAAGAWATAWAAEGWAYARLKAHLLRHGRRGLAPDEPLAPTILAHVGRL